MVDAFVVAGAPLTAPPHAAVPAPNMLESPNEIIADIAQLEVDLREELRLFRSRISHEILQNRTLSGS